VTSTDGSTYRAVAVWKAVCSSGEGAGLGDLKGQREEE